MSQPYTHAGRKSHAYRFCFYVVVLLPIAHRFNNIHIVDIIFYVICRGKESVEQRMAVCYGKVERRHIYVHVAAALHKRIFKVCQSGVHRVFVGGYFSLITSRYAMPLRSVVSITSQSGVDENLTAMASVIQHSSLHRCR